MVEKIDNMSVAELQQILKKQQTRVQQLQKKREKLLETIKEVEQEIAAISGGETGSIRFRNEQSLEKVICDVLAKNKKGLGLSELTKAIESTGYQSGSANFKNVVYQNVYKSEMITRDEKTGRYILA